MTRSRHLSYEFTETIPEDLADGTVYISTRFSTAVHKCCCGCGTEVVTPLSPNDWRLTFDGESVSLCPSVGNFGLPCQSHYWISSSTVVWADRRKAARRLPWRWSEPKPRYGTARLSSQRSLGGRRGSFRAFRAIWWRFRHSVGASSRH